MQQHNRADFYLTVVGSGIENAPRDDYRVLRTRFGEIPTELEDRIRSVLDKDALMQMTQRRSLL
jgi:hypothetical protein